MCFGIVLAQKSHLRKPLEFNTKEGNARYVSILENILALRTGPNDPGGGKDPGSILPPNDGGGGGKGPDPIMPSGGEGSSAFSLSGKRSSASSIDIGIASDNKSNLEGALKDIGDEDAIEVPEETKEAWKNKAASKKVKKKVIKGETINAKFIVDKDMPAGMSAYHFYDHEGNLVIVTRSEVKEGTITEEAAFHEGREAYWEQRLSKEEKELSKDIIEHYAHILASAEQAMRFGKDELTVYHLQQLDNMSEDKLGKLLVENRRNHYKIIRKYLGIKVLREAKRYEKRLRKKAFENRALRISAKEVIDKMEKRGKEVASRGLEFSLFSLRNKIKGLIVEDVHRLDERTYLLELQSGLHPAANVIVVLDELGNISTIYLANVQDYRSSGFGLKNPDIGNLKYYRVLPELAGQSNQDAHELIERIRDIISDKDELDRLADRTEKEQREALKKRKIWHILKGEKTSKLANLFNMARGIYVLRMLLLPEASRIGITRFIIGLEANHLKEPCGAMYDAQETIIMYSSFYYSSFPLDSLAHEIMHNIFHSLEASYRKIKLDPNRATKQEKEMAKKYRRLIEHFSKNHFGLLKRILSNRLYEPLIALIWLQGFTDRTDGYNLAPVINEAVSYILDALIANRSTTSFGTAITEADVNLFKELGILPQDFIYDYAETQGEMADIVDQENFENFLKDQNFSLCRYAQEAFGIKDEDMEAQILNREMQEIQDEFGKQPSVLALGLKQDSNEWLEIPNLESRGFENKRYLDDQVLHYEVVKISHNILKLGRLNFLKNIFYLVYSMIVNPNLSMQDKISLIKNIFKSPYIKDAFRRDRIASAFRRELESLGLDNKAIDEIINRGILNIERGQVKGNKDILRLLAEIEGTNVGTILRKSLFHERVHDLLFLMLGEEGKLRLFKDIKQGLGVDYQRVKNLMEEQFGWFETEEEFLEELIVKYYTYRFCGSDSEMFESDEMQNARRIIDSLMSDDMHDLFTIKGENDKENQIAKLIEVSKKSKELGGILKIEFEEGKAIKDLSEKIKKAIAKINSEGIKRQSIILDKIIPAFYQRSNL